MDTAPKTHRTQRHIPMNCTLKALSGLSGSSTTRLHMPPSTPDTLPASIAPMSLVSLVSTLNVPELSSLATHTHFTAMKRPQTLQDRLREPVRWGVTGRVHDRSHKHLLQLASEFCLPKVHILVFCGRIYLASLCSDQHLLQKATALSGKIYRCKIHSCWSSSFSLYHLAFWYEPQRNNYASI